MDYDYELYESEFSDPDSYYYSDEEKEVSVSPMTLKQVYELCLRPSVYEYLNSVYHVFLWCLVFRFSTFFINSSYSAHHIISFITGLLSLHVLFSSSVYYLVSLVILSYIVLFALTYFRFFKYRGIFLILTSFSYLCACELWLVSPKQWHRIRGPQMIVVMKSVSLAFDLDIGTVKTIPNLIQYAGYMLCPSSCVFGPWISFNEYKFHHNGTLSFKSVKQTLLKFLIGILFLTVSTCWSEYMIPTSSWKWLSAYRDALSFRTSHYFISYLSEVTLLLSGYSSPDFIGVTKPHLVEFPRSIVNVVIYWNVVMHNWLKIYVFNTSRRFGDFVAVLSTYIVSSLLHGINFQLSAVLLSLGLYSYVEVMLRKKLATAFSACILVKDCKTQCSHRHKKYHPLVLLANFFFVLLTVFHLAYLGVVFESSQDEETGYSWQHGIGKWSSLNYLSHYVALITYIVYLLIR